MVRALLKNNSLYINVDGPSWEDAEANANLLGGNLVSINSEEENEWLIENFGENQFFHESNFYETYPNNNFSTWIGLSYDYLNEEWEANDSSNQNYFSWHPSQIDSLKIGYENGYGTLNTTLTLSTNAAGWSPGMWDISWENQPISYYRNGIAEIPFLRRGNSLYVSVSGPTWEDAEANANLLGGNLVSINSEEENEWLIENFGENQFFHESNFYETYPNNNFSTWIGLSYDYLNEEWEANDSSNQNYFSWHPSQIDSLNIGYENGYGTLNTTLTLSTNAAGWSPGMWDISWENQPISYYRNGIAEIPLRFHQTGNFYNGTNSNDELEGLNGNDVFYGLGGNDVIKGFNGWDRLEGGAGNDKLFGGKKADNLIGGEGNDFLFGGSGWDIINGGNGNDTAIFGSTDNFINLGTRNRQSTGDGNDILTSIENINAGRGDDIVRGNSAANRLNGGAGADTLFGNAGDDFLIGGLGIDDMRGGAGDDQYFVDDAGDIVREGSNKGTDLVSSSVTYAIRNRNVENLTLIGSEDINGSGNASANIIRGNGGANRLIGGAARDTLYGNNGNDILNGGADGDTLYGNNGNDKLFGSIGNDNLFGNAGNDHLVGGNGNDRLIGGLGNDQLTGGGGNDIFQINTGVGKDVIKDYSSRGDSIQLLGGLTESDIKIRQVGGDVRINYGNDLLAIVQDTLIADLTFI